MENGAGVSRCARDPCRRLNNRGRASAPINWRQTMEILIGCFAVAAALLPWILFGMFAMENRKG